MMAGGSRWFLEKLREPKWRSQHQYSWEKSGVEEGQEEKRTIAKGKAPCVYNTDMCTEA